MLQIQNTQLPPKRTLVVVPYDPNWKALFLKEQKILSEKLGDCVIRIDHIGSTSVVGLAAKPIIDVLLEVSSLEAFDSLVNRFNEPEYNLKGENGIAGRRYIQKGGIKRSHHIHVFASGDINLNRHRAFAAYLNNNNDVAAEYGAIKRDAVSKSNNDIKTYMNLKNEFIQYHEQRAVHWYQNK